MSDQLRLPNFSDIHLDQVESQLKRFIQDSEQNVEAVLQAPESKIWSNFMQPMDNKDDEMHRFWSRVSHLHLVKDSPELRAVYDACLPHLTAYGTRMGHHKGLYQATSELQQSPEADTWCQAQKKTIENELRDFRLAGVDLPADKKVEMEALAQSLAQSCTQFSNNVLDATQSWTAHVSEVEGIRGLPEHVCVAAAAKAKEEGVRVILWIDEHGF